MPPRKRTPNWNGPQRCDHPGCTCTETFLTPGAMRLHHQNVHREPLFCPVPDCGHDRPFSRPRDLQRHMESKHGQSRPYKCPVETCREHEIGFRRKDYLKTHLETRHRHQKCLLKHCHDTVTETEQRRHLASCHGPYECRVGGCDGVSRFLEKNLKQHLRKHHGITFYCAEDIWFGLNQSNKTVVDEVETQKIKRVQDCKWCAEQRNPTTKSTETTAGAVASLMEATALAQSLE